jgi:hypothetical protein
MNLSAFRFAMRLAMEALARDYLRVAIAALTLARWFGGRLTDLSQAEVDLLTGELREAWTTFKIRSARRWRP